MAHRSASLLEGLRSSASVGGRLGIRHGFVRPLGPGRTTKSCQERERERDVNVSICLSIYLFFYLSTCLAVYLCVFMCI